MDVVDLTADSDEDAVPPGGGEALAEQMGVAARLAIEGVLVAIGAPFEVDVDAVAVEGVADHGAHATADEGAARVRSRHRRLRPVRHQRRSRIVSGGPEPRDVRRQRVRRGGPQALLLAREGAAGGRRAPRAQRGRRGQHLSALIDLAVSKETPGVAKPDGEES